MQAKYPRSGIPRSEAHAGRVAKDDTTGAVVIYGAHLHDGRKQSVSVKLNAGQPTLLGAGEQRQLQAGDEVCLKRRVWTEAKVKWQPKGHFKFEVVADSPTPETTTKTENVIDLTSSQEDDMPAAPTASSPPPHQSVFAAAAAEAGSSSRGNDEPSERSRKRRAEQALTTPEGKRPVGLSRQPVAPPPSDHYISPSDDEEQQRIAAHRLGEELDAKEEQERQGHQPTSSPKEAGARRPPRPPTSTLSLQRPELKWQPNMPRQWPIQRR